MARLVDIGKLYGCASAAVPVGTREMASVTGASHRETIDAFAHTLVPIALGYAIAHYASLLAFEGQRLLALASDPFGAGWDLFGAAPWAVNFTLLSPTAIAVLQAGAIVVGHVAGGVLAHDRAVARFDRLGASRGRHGLPAVMVVYTMGGLLLLLGG